MTRLNLVPVVELYDQHLFAEFREIKMVPKSLRRSLYGRDVLQVQQRVPKEYTLGKGHVMFFYDKGLYLRKRYRAIAEELGRRGYAHNSASQLDPDGMYDLEQNVHLGGWAPKFLNDYMPTPEALALVRARIAERVALKPEWYRYCGYAREPLGDAIQAVACHCGEDHELRP